MATRDSIFEQYREAILEGMARTLWLLAYADYIEEIGDKSADEQGLPRAVGGQDWDDVAPPTPKAASDAAKELVKLYETSAVNGPSIVELYGMAQTVDLEEDFEFTSDNAMPLIKSDTKARAEHMDQQWKMSDAEMFGHMLAHMALGTGVSWFDDHKEFKIEKPYFECHFNGEELDWSGGTHDVREVSGKLGDITVVNHDDADWTKHTYVIAFGGFTIATPQKLLIYANDLGSAIDELIDWVADNEPDSLANEQVEEQYNELIAEGSDEETARQEAEADTVSGGNAGDYIHQEDWHIVAEDPSEDDLQRIAGRKNPSDAEKCTHEYHKSLKADLAKWRTLELKGYQRHEADEFGPKEVYELRDCDRCPSTLTLKIEENPSQRSLWKAPRSRWTVDIVDHDGRVIQTQFFNSEDSARKYAAKIERPDLRIDVHPTGQHNPPTARDAAEKKARKRAESILAARRAAGFEGGCDDPNCRGWDVFEQDNDPLHGAGIGIQACDMCNSEAKQLGIPVLRDSDAAQLPEAKQALRRAIREARGA